MEVSSLMVWGIMFGRCIGPLVLLCEKITDQLSEQFGLLFLESDHISKTAMLLSIVLELGLISPRTLLSICGDI